MSDEELQSTVTAAGTGDAESFRRLFILLEPAVYAYVRGRVPVSVEANDVVEDILVGLFRSLATFEFRSKGQFYQYVYTIARRELASQYKQTKKVAQERIEVPLEEVADSGSSHTTKLAVQQALACLDDTSRDIMLLHHWSRYTFVEIGEILGLGESAVRVRHHRAKQQLATLLTP